MDVTLQNDAKTALKGPGKFKLVIPAGVEIICELSEGAQIQISPVDQKGFALETIEKPTEAKQQESDDVKQKIVLLLKAHPNGLKALQIAKEVLGKSATTAQINPILYRNPSIFKSTQKGLIHSPTWFLI
jgi:hypothetical protein